jgi:hypothetical protein
MFARPLGRSHRVQQLGDLPAADDGQVREVLEIGRDGFGNTGTDPVIGCVTRHVGERKDGDAPLTRFDPRCPHSLC